MNRVDHDSMGKRGTAGEDPRPVGSTRQPVSGLAVPLAGTGAIPTGRVTFVDVLNGLTTGSVTGGLINGVFIAPDSFLTRVATRSKRPLTAAATSWQVRGMSSRQSVSKGHPRRGDEGRSNDDTSDANGRRSIRFVKRCTLVPKNTLPAADHFPRANCPRGCSARLRECYGNIGLAGGRAASSASTSHTFTVWSRLAE